MTTLQSTNLTARQSPRDGDDSSVLWKEVKAANETIKKLTTTISAMQRTIAELKSGRNAASGLHPFKIYKLPDRLRTDPDDGMNWLRVRVRTGGAMVVSFDNAPSFSQPSNILINVAGTDGAANPDIETYLDNPGALDILVPAGAAAYYFWVTLTVDPSGENPATAQLFYGASPDQASPQADTWNSFPQPDPYHKVIGYVDSLTLLATKTLLVRQIARQDMEFYESNLYNVCDNENNVVPTLMIGGVPE